MKDKVCEPASLKLHQNLLSSHSLQSFSAEYSVVDAAGSSAGRENSDPSSGSVLVDMWLIDFMSGQQDVGVSQGCDSEPVPVCVERRL